METVMATRSGAVTAVALLLALLLLPAVPASHPGDAPEQRLALVEYFTATWCPPWFHPAFHFKPQALTARSSAAEPSAERVYELVDTISDWYRYLDTPGHHDAEAFIIETMEGYGLRIARQ